MEYLLIIASILAGFGLISIILGIFLSKKATVKGNYFIAGTLLIGFGLTLMFMYLYHHYPQYAIFEVFKSFGIYVSFILFFAVIVVIIHHFINIPGYVYRKLLHIIMTLAIFPLIYSTHTYWITLIVLAMMLGGVTVGLLIIERLSFYQSLFAEKKKHEVMISFIFYFVVCALLIYLFWGLKGESYIYIIFASILAWGLGDAAAAIIGNRFGKPILHGVLIEGHKSIEGSIANFVVASISALIILLIFAPYAWYYSILIALGVGLVSTIFELFTRFGLDNLTIPLSVAGILFLITLI